MQPARIAELLSPFLERTDERLTIDDLNHISTYIDLLLRWNARINLTAIRDPEQIVTRHFGESLFAARHLFPNRNVGTAAPGCPDQHAVNRAEETMEDKRASASETGRAAETRKLAETGRLPERGRAALQGRVTGHDQKGASAPAVADIGSGAGFPGIPIKLWAPEITLTLIESNHKKSAFLREVTRALTLTNVNIQTARAETLATSFDVVTFRAVEHFEAILPASARLVAPGGRLALLIGSGQFAEANTLLPDLDWSEPVPIPLAAARVFAIATRASNKATQVS